MPSKRKSTSSAVAQVAPKCFTRICYSLNHPGDDESTTLNSTSPMALADFVTRSLEAHQKDIAGQLADVTAALQANVCQLNNITTLLHEISHHLITIPFSCSFSSQHDILSQ